MLLLSIFHRWFGPNPASFFTTCLLSKRGTDITGQASDMIINKQKPPEKTNDWLHSNSEEQAFIEKLITFPDENPLGNTEKCHLFDIWFDILFRLSCCYISSLLPNVLLRNVSLHYFLELDTRIVGYFCPIFLFFDLSQPPSCLLFHFRELNATPFHGCWNVSGEGVNTAPGVVYLTPLWPLTKPY